MESLDDFTLLKILGYVLGHRPKMRTKRRLALVCHHWMQVLSKPYHLGLMAWKTQPILTEPPILKKPHLFRYSDFIYMKDPEIGDISHDDPITLSLSGEYQNITQYPSILCQLNYVIREIELKHQVVCQPVIDFVLLHLPEIETLTIDLNDPQIMTLINSIAHQPNQIRRLVIDWDYIEASKLSKMISYIVSRLPTLVNVTLISPYGDIEIQNVNDDQYINHIKELHLKVRCSHDPDWIRRRCMGPCPRNLGQMFPQVQRIIINEYYKNHVNDIQLHFPHCKEIVVELTNNWYVTIDSDRIGIDQS